MDWLPADRTAIASILDRIPSSYFVLTAAHGEVRCAALVRWVQQCAKTPPMLMVAIEKGQALSAIIRDSHGFAMCQLHRDERILRRMVPSMPENGADPFLSIPHMRAPSGAPVPLRAMSWFDCEMLRHIDIEADTEIYVGVVHHASIVQPGAGVPCHCATEPIEASARSSSVSVRPGQPAAHASTNGSNGASRMQPITRSSPHRELKRPHRSTATNGTTPRSTKQR